MNRIRIKYVWDKNQQNVYIESKQVNGIFFFGFCLIFDYYEGGGGVLLVFIQKYSIDQAINETRKKNTLK